MDSHSDGERHRQAGLQPLRRTDQVECKLDRYARVLGTRGGQSDCCHVAVADRLYLFGGACEGIYVFTDGVTEANNTAEGMFGDRKRFCGLPASLGVPRS